MSVESKARVRAMKREFVRNLKSKPCTECGHTFPPECMDFDHRPGEKKLRAVSKMFTLSLERILEEVAKCDLVCANCHRIRTYRRGQYDPSFRLKDMVE